MRYTTFQVDNMRLLRQKGYSIVEISNSLNIPKSTVLRYTKNTEILPEYQKRWEERKRSSIRLKENHLLKAKELACSLLSNPESRESAILSATLYWAEGSKKDFSISNTDPKLISVFMDSLKKVFNLHNDDFTISIRTYEDLNKDACIKYWSNIVKIKLNKNTKINILTGKKQGKLKYGMCRIRVKKSGIIHKTLFAIVDQITESVSPHSLVDKTKDS